MPPVCAPVAVSGNAVWRLMLLWLQVNSCQEHLSWLALFSSSYIHSSYWLVFRIKFVIYQYVCSLVLFILTGLISYGHTCWLYLPPQLPEASGAGTYAWCPPESPAVSLAAGFLHWEDGPRAPGDFSWFLFPPRKFLISEEFSSVFGAFISFQCILNSVLVLSSGSETKFLLLFDY